MENDLISREALRESVIKQIKNHKDITFKEIAEIWIDCLNNAPTVHYITDNCGDKCEFERPQGEWDKRHTELLKYFVKCEKCGEEIMTSHKNFCPNCGAKMKQG